MRCYGLPLHAWSDKVFKAIGNRYGDVLGVDKETIDKSFLEFGRIYLKVGDRVIWEDLWLDVLGNKYQVEVREEKYIIGGHGRVLPERKRVNEGFLDGMDAFREKGVESLFESSDVGSRESFFSSKEAAPMGVEVAPMGVVLSKQDSGRSGDDGSDRGSSLKTKPRELLPRHLAVSTRDEEARDANMSKQGMHVWQMVRSVILTGPLSKGGKLDVRLRKRRLRVWVLWLVWRMVLL